MEIIQKYFKNLSPLQIEQLEQLEELYTNWNEKINVISRKDMESLYEKHVLHSLSIAKFYQPNSGSRIVDIGTGGGFPGIPLAIFFPDCHFVLMDSIRKKIKVVEGVIAALQLKNAEGVWSRVEEWEGKKFDLAVTRAVAPLDRLGNWSKHLLKKNNEGLICLKGGDLSLEIEESGMKTKSYAIKDIYEESFFETKLMTHSVIKI